MTKVKNSDIVESDLFVPTTQQAQALVDTLYKLVKGYQDVLLETKKVAAQNPFATMDNVKQAAVDLDTAKKASEDLEKVNKQLKVATEALNRNLQLEQQVLTDVKGGLDSNIRLLAQYKAEQKSIAEAIKIQNDRLKNNIITQKEHEQSIAGSLKRQIELKIATSQLTQTINAQIKENTAAAGSMDAIAQNVGQLKSAYRALNEEERNNVEIGGVLLKAIEEEDAKIKALDATIGNFQRNVGNYANAFSGAMDTLQNELAQVREELSSSDLSGKQLEALQKRETLLIKITKDLNREFKSTREQQKVFRQATQELGIALGQQNKTFEEFKNQVGEGVDALADINDAIKLAASDTSQLDRLIGAANGLAGAFGVAEGAAALFGDENEDLQKTFTKLTAITTVLNGLQAIQAELRNKDSIATKIQIGLQRAYTAVIGTSTGALKAFKTALVATGLGALVVLLGVLVANWDRVKSVLNIGVNPATKKLAEETQKAYEASEKAMEAFDLEERSLRALGTAEIDIANIRKQTTEQALIATKARLDTQKTVLEETIKNRELWKKAGFNILGVTDDDVKEAQTLLEELETKYKEYSVALQEANNDIVKETEANARLIEDLRLEAMADGLDKQLQAERLRYQRQIEDLGENYDAIEQSSIIHENNLAKIRKDFADKAVEDEFKYRQLVINNMTDGLNKELANAKLNYDRQKREFAGNKKALVQLEIAYQQTVDKIQQDEARRYQRLLDEIRDMSVESLQDETTRELSALYLQNERRKDSLRERYKDHDQLNNALLLLDKSYEAARDKIIEDRKKRDEENALQDKQDAIKYSEDLAKAQLDQQRANFDDEVKWEEYKAKELRKIRIAAINAQLEVLKAQTDKESVLLREQLKAELAGLNAEIKTGTEKTAQEIAKTTAKNLDTLAKETNKYFDNQAAKREKQIGKELDASKKRQDDLKALAIAGNKDAQASIAAEDKKQAELERVKENEARKAKRRELALSALSTYNSKVQSGDPNALPNTIKDLGLLLAAVNSIPVFFEGTEDTGAGGNMDGKGGFLSILHPRERVVDAKTNAKFGGIANEEAGNIIEMYNSGMFTTASKIPEFYQHDTTAVFKEMNSKLDNVEAAIKNIPVTTTNYDTVSKIVEEVIETRLHTIVNKTKIGQRFNRN